MHYEYQDVSIASLDANGDTFRITSDNDIEALAFSIRSIGLLNPPFVKPLNNGYQVISGFRRIKAYSVLGFESIRACLLKADTSFFDCAKIAIWDNLLQRPLNVIEHSRAVCLLSEIYTDMQDLVKVTGEMGIPNNPSYLMSLKKIGSLAPKIQNMILNNQISLKTGVKLFEFDSETRANYFNIFSRLKMSVNLQKEMITHIGEISRREGLSVSHVFADIEALGILKNDQYDTPAKTQKIRKYLQNRRYPELSHAQQKMRESILRLKLPSEIKLMPPDHFEGHVYSLQLEFKSKKQLNRQLKLLQDILAKEDFNQIMEI